MVVNGLQINRNCHPKFVKQGGNGMNDDNFLNPFDRFRQQPAFISVGQPDFYPIAQFIGNSNF